MLTAFHSDFAHWRRGATTGQTRDQLEMFFGAEVWKHAVVILDDSGSIVEEGLAEYVKRTSSAGTKRRAA